MAKLQSFNLEWKTRILIRIYFKQLGMTSG